MASFSRSRDRPEDRSFGQLLRDLVEQIGRLIGNEGRLLKAELNDGVNRLAGGFTLLILGALLGSSALLILLLAAVAALSEVMAAWAASLIVGGAVALVAVILLLAGRNRLKAKTLVPDRTLASVGEDVRMAREHLK
ncbi:MAG TPA: phage holin family protein [Kiloniellales bacterium]|nr:phage holin family protein [Kiloniellales bacterium]